MTHTEERYQENFEHAPVSLWEVDLTALYGHLDELAAQGVTDFEGHFGEHPESAVMLAGKVRILDVSRYAIRLQEAETKEELLGAIDRTFAPASYSDFTAMLAALASGATQFEAEVHSRTLRDRHMLLRFTLTVLAPREGRRRGLVSLVDISERKHMEDALRHANTVLERSNEELEHFAYVASHDLQEPLRMIASYSQLLARRYGDQLDERAGKYIHYVTDGAKRMQDLISDLLDLSRVGTRGKPLRPVECASILENVQQSMRVMLGERNAEITCDPLPVIMADELQLAQLFQNLVSNGIKFNRAATPRVQISAERQGSEWIIAFRDNGIGMEEKYLDAVFLAFRRLHARDEYPGTGIGLAIAKKIVERHGGRIWVTSKPGAGSAFFVALKSA